MKNTQVMDCNQPTAIKLQRVNFFSRQLLTADDLITDRDYLLQKLRRHNRFLHGWGVVCGLTVAAAPVASAPWRVQIGSGCALGPYGDEIFVGEAVYFDVAACLSAGVTSPCDPGTVTSGGAGATTAAYLAIKYAECMALPMLATSSGCGCDDDPCQYSRILDSFQIQCLSELPAQPAAPPTLCQVAKGGVLAPCPPCPASPWLVLATITLPAASTADIANSNIDNVTNRRVILSTAMLEDQIVRCCCGPASSSSSAAVLRPVTDRPAFTQTGPMLIVGQRTTRVAGAQPGATQIAATVMNSGLQTAENVVLTVDLTPVLSAEEYTLTSAAGWQSATLGQLKSAPVSIPAGKAQTFSFQIAPVKQSTAVTITSAASAAAATPGISGTASRLQAIVGG